MKPMLEENDDGAVLGAGAARYDWIKVMRQLRLPTSRQIRKAAWTSGYFAGMYAVRLVREAHEFVSVRGLRAQVESGDRPALRLRDGTPENEVRELLGVSIDDVRCRTTTFEMALTEYDHGWQCGARVEIEDPEVAAAPPEGVEG